RPEPVFPAPPGPSTLCSMLLSCVSCRKGRFNWHHKHIFCASHGIPSINPIRIGVIHLYTKSTFTAWRQPFHPSKQWSPPPMSESADYVIVGAGSAGCVLANRLSEGGKYRVTLLEAGPPDSNVWIHIPIGYGKTMFSKKLNWRYHTEPDPNMLGRQIYWPRGKTLGGSSSINGLIYIRGQKQDYDHW